MNKLAHVREFSRGRGRVHKMKTKKIGTYPCIPIWLKETPKDRFNYKLRSKEEIARGQREFGADLLVTMYMKKYFNIDQRYVSTNQDIRNSIAKISINPHEMGLTYLQKERFLYLVGARYNGSDTVKLCCKRFDNYSENMHKVLEMLQELHWEALRAPTEEYNLLCNRSMYEQRKKQKGKTKEQREKHEEERERKHQQFLRDEERREVEGTKGDGVRREGEIIGLVGLGGHIPPSEDQEAQELRKQKARFELKKKLDSKNLSSYSRINLDDPTI